MEPQVKKLVQKRAYDLLSHRYGLLMILLGIIVITVSAFHFGEVSHRNKTRSRSTLDSQTASTRLHLILTHVARPRVCVCIVTAIT